MANTTNCLGDNATVGQRRLSFAKAMTGSKCESSASYRLHVQRICTENSIVRPSLRRTNNRPQICLMLIFGRDEKHCKHQNVSHFNRMRRGSNAECAASAEEWEMYDRHYANNNKFIYAAINATAHNVNELLAHRWSEEKEEQTHKLHTVRECVESQLNGGCRLMCACMTLCNG